MDTITPGAKVLYHNTSPCLGGGVWSGIVTRVAHLSSLGLPIWAWVTFDGIVVPDNCAHGIAGPCMGRAWDTVQMKDLTLRQPCIDDAEKAALWATKVAALDEQKRLSYVAAKQAEKEAQMAACSHFRVGQTVTWRHMVAMGWGPQPDLYATYAGTITAIDLPALMAVVMGAPQRHYGSPMHAEQLKVPLSLLQLVACPCGISCAPGYYCGSQLWRAAQQQAAPTSDPVNGAIALADLEAQLLRAH